MGYVLDFTPENRTLYVLLLVRVHEPPVVIDLVRTMSGRHERDTMYIWFKSDEQKIKPQGEK